MEQSQAFHLRPAGIAQMTAPDGLLPYARQSVDDDDIGAVVDVLRGDWLTTGPAVQEFEAALGARVGAKHAVACSSGTAALHLATMALGVRGENGAVIVPTIGFLASANAVRYCGAEVVFADVNPETGLMETQHVEAALAASDQLTVRAIMPVHYSGQCQSPAALAGFAHANNLKIIEDAAHALGTTYDRSGEVVAIGSCRDSDAAAFSFHAVKTVAMGEGGAVTTNDDSVADKVRLLRNHGMTRDSRQFADEDQAFASSGAADPWYYEMQEIGFNYRASDIHCALGASQLKKLDGFVARRRSLASKYDERLAHLAPRVRPLTRAPDCVAAWHLYVVGIDFAGLGLERAEVVSQLRERGIGTQVHYLPIHRQPYYRSRYGHQTLPGADRFYTQILSLPLFVGMTDSDVDRVADALAQVVASAPKKPRRLTATS